MRAPVIRSNVASPAPMYTYVIVSINACGCVLLLCWEFEAIAVTTVNEGWWMVEDVAKLARGYPHLLGERNRRERLFVLLQRKDLRIETLLLSVNGEPYSSVFGINIGLPIMSVWGFGVGVFWVCGGGIIWGCGVGHPNLSVNDWRSFEWNTTFLLIFAGPAPLRNDLGLGALWFLEPVELKKGKTYYWLKLVLVHHTTCSNKK